MTKAQFIYNAHEQGYWARYSGKQKTFYLKKAYTTTLEYVKPSCSFTISFEK